jgi:hypothetical protein
MDDGGVAAEQDRIRGQLPLSQRFLAALVRMSDRQQADEMQTMGQDSHRFPLFLRITVDAQYLESRSFRGQ